MRAEEGLIYASFCSSAMINPWEEEQGVIRGRSPRGDAIDKDEMRRARAPLPLCLVRVNWLDNANLEKASITPNQR